MLIVRSFIAEPLEDGDLDLKEDYIKQGFFEWTRRDFAPYPGVEIYGMVCFQLPFCFVFGRSETWMKGSKHGDAGW